MVPKLVLITILLLLHKGDGFHEGTQEIHHNSTPVHNDDAY